MTPEQELRLYDLNQWYEGDYLPMDSEIKSTELVTGKPAAKLRRNLGRITEKRFKDAR